MQRIDFTLCTHCTTLPGVGMDLGQVAPSAKLPEFYGLKRFSVPGLGSALSGCKQYFTIGSISNIQSNVGFNPSANHQYSIIPKTLANPLCNMSQKFRAGSCYTWCIF